MTDEIRPAPVPGHYVPEDAAPAFDPEAVVASVDRPSRETGTIAGDHDEPAQPMLPPPGVEIPEDIATALAEYNAACDKWRDAVEAAEDFRYEARVSRARYADAIRAAGRAVAAGRKRPSLPKFVSEAAEAEEMEIRRVAINELRHAADRAARRVDDLVLKHAHEWVDEVAARCHPAAQEAQRAIVDAMRAYERALSALNQVAWLRAAAHVQMLKEAGLPVNQRTMPKLADEYLAAILPRAFKDATRWGNDPYRQLEQANNTVGTLVTSMPDAIPHPDTVTTHGIDGGALARVLRYWRERASEEARRDYDRRTRRGGRYEATLD